MASSSASPTSDAPRPSDAAASPSATPPEPPIGKWREFGYRVLLVAVSLLIAFLLLEVYVRATWQPRWFVPRAAMRAPGIFTARMKPDGEFDIPLTDGGSFHVVTNARGFRGPLVSSMAKSPLKVLSLGDSYMFGWGLKLEEQCMSRFVAGYRAAHPDRDVGHAYVACHSWDPKDYYYGYLTEAADVRPDLVVVGVFIGNDVMPPDAPRILDPAKARSVDTLDPPSPPLFRSIGWLDVQLTSGLLSAQVGLRARRRSTSTRTTWRSRRSSGTRRSST
jgi:hypothetical protein